MWSSTGPRHKKMCPGIRTERKPKPSCASDHGFAVSDTVDPASILYNSIAGRYRPVRLADGPITARYRFIKNVYRLCRTA